LTTDWQKQRNDAPAYNVAPTDPVPFITAGENGAHTLREGRWWLVPWWAKELPKAAMFNARIETADTSGAFKDAFASTRCLIPADGFYEWKTEGERRRPFAIVPRTGGPIAFAGLWEVWTGPNGEEVETAAIVTTRANRALSPLHDRMPVVLTPEAYDLWLDCRNVDANTAAALLAPAPDDFFNAYEVSPAVNRTANDAPELLVPASEAPPAPEPEKPAKPKRDDRQGSLF
jgi:putative SOS response-associated peptidase YedK